jgi:gas vesicle protein
MANEHSGPGFGTGLILGSIIGAFAGLLLAPKPGEETRHQVAQKTAGLRIKAEELAVEARDLVREIVEEGKVVADRIRSTTEEEEEEEEEEVSRQT